ncbi:F-box/FBD/LRR-repeat protein At1g16930-like [Chenopodium quinoa]|uniref:F-box/FBD/LRR-repeat protein At1g16930-like n=1 Tax=Chenopodium quinoa TaxID=63459 RepID=UPI000B77D646|nr:F-box/FBD/LRR-repeat protein At1g16930-like [Chenopodium quinoa]
MVDGKIMKCYIRKQRRRSRAEEEDRLSSLPDVILTNILSRLPIHVAIATSVLSHRWRRVWTGITCVEIVTCRTSGVAAMFDCILRQLTSRKLHVFDLALLEVFKSPEISESEIELWVREVCSRNVEDIRIDAHYDSQFCVPAILFNSQSLVTLKLWGLLQFKWPEIGSLCFHLPNLKSLNLCKLIDVPLSLGTLLRSCPHLEHLDLDFDLADNLHFSLSSSVVNIIAPNLKSLSIHMLYTPGQISVYIDAPKLENLKIENFYSIYYFLRNPTVLKEARIELMHDEWYGLESDDEEEKELDYGSLSEARKEYLHQMTKFVGGMSTVTNLELRLESLTNIFKYQNPVKLPIFSNVAHLETNFLKDLMFSLHCFPNLEHLKVSDCDDKMEQTHKTIQIWRLKGTDDNLRFLAYILRNAFVLEKLLVKFHMVDGEYDKYEREKAYAVWKECQFCKSLMKLPRSSLTCQLELSGRSVIASGNGLQGGYLPCQIFMG